MGYDMFNNNVIDDTENELMKLNESNNYVDSTLLPYVVEDLMEYEARKLRRTKQHKSVMGFFKSKFGKDKNNEDQLER